MCIRDSERCVDEAVQAVGRECARCRAGQECLGEATAGTSHEVGNERAARHHVAVGEVQYVGYAELQREADARDGEDGGRDEPEAEGQDVEVHLASPPAPTRSEQRRSGTCPGRRLTW